MIQICRLENLEQKNMKQVSYSGRYSLSASRAHQSHLQFCFVVWDVFCQRFLHVQVFNYHRESYMRPVSFCTKLNSEQFLFKAFFNIMQIFGSVEPLSKSIFLFQHMIIFQRWQSSVFVASQLHSCGRYALIEFFIQNLMLNNFYLKHFLIQCIFLAALSPKVNLLSHFGSL